MNTKKLMWVCLWFFSAILISIIAEIVMHFKIIDDYTIGYFAGALVAIAYYEMVHGRGK